MKKIAGLLLCTTIFFAACTNLQTSGSSNNDSTTTLSSADPSKDWKLGVALWTFHDVDFPTALARVDSAGLVYIEPNTFVSAGAEFKDSIIGQLSMTGIDKLKALITAKI